MKRFILLSICLFTTLASEAKLVDLTNKSGQTIRCEIIKLEGENVKLKRNDGRFFTYPMKDLDEQSQSIVKEQIQLTYIPRLDVRSIKSSKRESDHVDIYGRKHMYVNKSRLFEIEVSTFSPLDTPVVVEWYYVKGQDSYTKGTKKGVVSSNVRLIFDATQSTSWYGLDRNGRNLGRNVDYSTGSKRLDLVVLLKSSGGEILREYYTSRNALDMIKHLPD